MINKILARCIKEDSCLVWIGCFQKSGKNGQALYPSISFKGKTKRGNRLVWSLLNGDIPNGLCICHSCDNTKCLNPDHLFAASHSENMQDKIKKGRDHNLKKKWCINGHEFSKDNTIIRKDGARSCRQCMRKYWNRFDAKNRESRRVKALQQYYARKES